MFGTSNLNTSYQTDNIAGALTTTIQTSLDGQQLQHQPLRYDDPSAWRMMHRYYQGSALANERNWLIHGGLWTDELASSSTKSTLWGESNIHENGLDLQANPVNYVIDIAKAAAAAAVSTTQVTWVVTQKQLVASPSGITFN